MEIFLIWLIFAALVGWLAHSRGRSGFGFFLVSVLLSPLVGLIAVLVTKNLADEQRTEQLRREEHERQLESIRAIAVSRPPSPEGQVKAQASSGSVADEIAKLAELRKQGVLTDSEFQQQKVKLLNSTELPSAKSESATTAGPLTGLCPNCDSEILVSSPTCPKCKADFTSGAAWAIKPLRHAAR